MRDEGAGRGGPVLPGRRLSVERPNAVRPHRLGGRDDAGTPSYRQLHVDGLIVTVDGWAARPAEEQRVATWLAEQGLPVLPVRESNRVGVHTPDAITRDQHVPVEFKTPQESTQVAFSRAVRNGRRQARHGVIDLRRCGMDEDQALRFLEQSLAGYGAALDEVLLIGDGYDWLWTRR